MSIAKHGVDECIFMLDCARKYLSPIWIKKLIYEISNVGYNTLIIHFSEEMGLRLESTTYPWLAGGDHSLCVWGAAHGEPECNGKFITQDEMADIVRFAHSRGIKVIPSFDSPGHMNYAVKKYNERYGSNISNYFHKHGKVSIVHGSSVNKEEAQLAYSRGIDISNPEAVAFAKSLYAEYGLFFRELGCTEFDIGGDELLGFGETIDDSLSKWQNLEHWDAYAKERTGNPDAVAYDAFILYMNDICDLLRSIGYTSFRMWNDDAYRDFDTGWRGVVDLDPDIEIQYWSGSANDGKNTAQFYLDKGRALYNFEARHTYYTLYSDKAPSSVTPEEIEKNWNAYVFDSKNPDNTLKAPSASVKGAGMCLWTDTPARQSEDELLENIRPYFTAIAKKVLGKS